MIPNRDDLDEDEPIVLPPLDADEEDEPSVEGDEEIDALPEGDGDPFDDAETGHVDGDEEIDETREDGGDDGEGVDIGALDEGIDLDEEARAGDDERGGFDGDRDDEVEDHDVSSDDGGSEGTSDAPEDEVDESAFPDLDEDEDVGEGEGEDLATALLAESSDGPAWDASRWAATPGAGASVPCGSVSVHRGRVVAAGEVVLVIEEGALAARRAPIATSATLAAITDDLLVVATARGGLLASFDGGATAAAIAGFRGALSRIDLAATNGRIWIASEGALYSIAPIDQRLVTARDRGVLAIAASGGVLGAITRDANGPALVRIRRDDEAWLASPLDEVARSIVDRDRGIAPAHLGSGRTRLAIGAAGKLVAIGDGARVAISCDGGATFTALDLQSVVAFTFAGEDEAAPLVAIVAPRESGSLALLVSVDAAANASKIAELGLASALRAEPRDPSADAASHEGVDGCVAALAWDVSRDALWVATRAGLAAFARGAMH